MSAARRTASAPRLEIDAAGWVPALQRIESPNCDERPDGTDIALIVIHGISLPPGQYGGGHIERLFTNTLDHDAHPYFDGLRGLRVSAHFLIRRDGEPIQFVSCLRRAWHAGVSCWQGRNACNDYSIGIEFEGTDDSRYEPEQYRRGAELITVLRETYPIRGIAGHCHIAPGRKTDPGPHFDWLALRQPASLFAS